MLVILERDQRVSYKQGMLFLLLNGPLQQKSPLQQFDVLV